MDAAFLAACRRGDAAAVAGLLPGALSPGCAGRGLLAAERRGRGAAVEAILAWAERGAAEAAALAALPAPREARVGLCRDETPEEGLRRVVREEGAAGAAAHRGRLRGLGPNGWRALFAAAAEGGGAAAVRGLVALHPPALPELALCWAQWAWDIAGVERALRAGSPAALDALAFSRACRASRRAGPEGEAALAFASRLVRTLRDAGAPGTPVLAFGHACRAHAPLLARWYFSPAVGPAELEAGLEALCRAREADPGGELESFIDLLYAAAARRARGRALGACCGAGCWGRAQRLWKARAAAVRAADLDWPAVLQAADPAAGPGGDGPGLPELAWLVAAGGASGRRAGAAMARRARRTAVLDAAPEPRPAAPAFLRACRADLAGQAARLLRAEPGLRRLGLLLACAAGARGAAFFLLGLGEVDPAAAGKAVRLAAAPGRPAALALELSAEFAARGFGAHPLEAVRGACRRGDPPLLAEVLGALGEDALDDQSLVDALLAGNLPLVEHLVCGFPRQIHVPSQLAPAVEELVLAGAGLRVSAAGGVRALLAAAGRKPGWGPAAVAREARAALARLGGVPRGVTADGLAAVGVLAAAAGPGPFCEWRGALAWPGSLRAAWAGAVARAAQRAGAPGAAAGAAKKRARA